MSFLVLPKPCGPRGKPRRVGFEMEFVGLSVEEAVRVVEKVVSGPVSSPQRYTYEIENRELGTFKIEIDSQVLVQRTYREAMDKVGLHPKDSAAGEQMERWLTKAALAVVPCEVVTPPLPREHFALTEELREALRLAGAKGTHESMLYAFGLHLNPEAPALDADTLCRYLQAYVLVEPQLREEVLIDLTRRVVPFVDPFPAPYRRRLADPHYRPNLPGLIADYLAANPTRNRSLDMLPLFAHVAPDAVRGQTQEDHLIKPRPAFHYRLPDCRIDDARWRIATEWNHWVRVERVAEEPRLLQAVIRAAQRGEVTQLSL